MINGWELGCCMRERLLRAPEREREDRGLIRVLIGDRCNKINKLRSNVKKRRDLIDGDHEIEREMMSLGGTKNTTDRSRSER